MSDLIRRADVLALAKDVTLKNGAKHRCIDATLVHEIPSAEPKRKKGYWTEDSDPGQIIGEHYSCSECRACFGTLKSNFCPNCGAKMRD